MVVMTVLLSILVFAGMLPNYSTDRCHDLFCEVQVIILRLDFTLCYLDLVSDFFLKKKDLV